MLARDIMSENVATIHPGAPLSAALRKMDRYRVSALPVVQDDLLVGIITRLDIPPTRADSAPEDEEIVTDYMTMPPITCSEDMPIEAVRNLLVDRDIAQVPVISSQERLVGIIGRSDFVSEVPADEPQAA